MPENMLLTVVRSSSIGIGKLKRASGGGLRKMQYRMVIVIIHLEMDSHIFILKGKHLVDKKVLIVLHKYSFRYIIHVTLVGLYFHLISVHK
jgi:hypothetical protein